MSNSEDPWNMSDRDPVADIKEAFAKISEPNAERKRRLRNAQTEEELYKLIQLAYDEGMTPEEIFNAINGPFF
jgi:hypothetical protein